jgi:hypothetical protein
MNIYIEANIPTFNTLTVIKWCIDFNYTGRNGEYFCFKSRQGFMPHEAARIINSNEVFNNNHIAAITAE